MSISTTQPLTYPARPVNGGRFDLAPPKRGAWLYQPKYNGWRVLLNLVSGATFNRHLEPLSIGSEFGAAIEQLRVRLDDDVEWVDCEGLERRHGLGRGTLIVLDIPTLQSAAADRILWLSRRLPMFGLDTKPESNTVYRPPCWHGMSGVVDSMSPIEEGWRRMQEINREWGCEFYEGYVCRKIDERYPIQLRSSSQETPWWVKHRFA